MAIQTSPPYSLYENAVAERACGTIVGDARRLMRGAPRLPREQWAEAVKSAIYIKNRTPTNDLDGKAPLEVREDKPLKSLRNVHG